MSRRPTDRRTFLASSLAASAAIASGGVLHRAAFAAPAKKKWESLFNGKTLGDSITESFEKFPQRDAWRLNQLNISGGKAIPIYGNIEIFADGDLIYLNHSDYSAVIAAPNYNLKLKAGLRLVTASVVFELYCNYYHNNLIGFEPITFNQRTEHYFDRPYGNVGIKAEIRF